MISSDKIIVQELVQSCLEHGIRNVVVSPGSRNAPLVIAFDEHPDIECKLIHDERSAAFVAMGMIQQLGRPVAVLCTSGSAVLNYYPAVSEAYYQRIPLVVISADRPQKWINQGDGQTIVQANVFNNHIDAQVVIEEGEQEATEKLQATLATLKNPSKGPIHINVAVNEPLYGTVEVPYLTVEEKMHQSNKEAFIDEVVLADLLKSSKKKMILIGQMPKNEYLNHKLMQLAADPSFAILVENTSNQVSREWVHCIDRTLARISEEQKEEFKPDFLITMGGAVISKRIKAFLRTHKPKQHWKIGFDFPEMDTYECLTNSLQVSETTFIQKCIDLKPELPTSNFGAKWKQTDFIAQDKGLDYINQVSYSDLSVIHTIHDFVPDDSNLHMANSSVVRYFQLLDPIKKVNYYSNRGTSGIDGSSSTAVGHAMANPDAFHTLVTGDVSFFYDSNAFWNNYNLPNLRIVMVNNGGGGIFNIIPGPKTTAQNDDYFVAKHQHSAEHICKAYHIDYKKVTSLEELEKELTTFYNFEENGTGKLIEVDTTTVQNEEYLLNFFKAVAE